MGEMMNIAGFYDEPRWIEWFTNYSNPADAGDRPGNRLVVLLLYMPIFDLAGSIQ